MNDLQKAAAGARLKAAREAKAQARKDSTVEAKATQAEINADLQVRAARQAAKVKDEQADAPEMVTCRVLKNGDGKISMGVHVAGVGEVHYERGETFEAIAEIAAELEDRGFVEIQ